MLSHSKILLVVKVGFSGLLDSSMMLMFCGILLLDPSGRSDMRQRRVGASHQPLMIISPLQDMSYPVPCRKTSQPVSDRIDADGQQAI